MPRQAVDGGGADFAPHSGGGAQRGPLGNAGTGGIDPGGTSTGQSGGAGSSGPGNAGSSGSGGSLGAAGTGGANAGTSGQSRDGAAELVGPSDAADVGDAQVDDGPGDLPAADTAPDASVSSCQVAVSLDRSCRDNTDCVVVRHVSNCCGQQRLMGLRAAEKGAFQTLEGWCVAAYPTCDCAAGLPTTDDGSALPPDSAPASVACIMGVCTTFVPACKHPCASGTSCHTCNSIQPDGKIQPYAMCSAACSGAASCTVHEAPKCQAGSTGAMFCTAPDVNCSPQ